MVQQYFSRHAKAGQTNNNEFEENNVLTRARGRQPNSEYRTFFFAISKQKERANKKRNTDHRVYFTSHGGREKPKNIVLSVVGRRT